MRLNSKVTWGLAWTGLAIVLAVPSADFLTGKLAGDSKAAVLTSTTEPVKTASVTTTKTPTGLVITPAGAKPPKSTGAPTKSASKSTDPVDKFVQSGKKLPDYIAGAPASTKPDANETQVAIADPKAVPVAPTPFPTWARPKAVPAPAAAPVEPAIIVDESTLTGSITPPAADPVQPTTLVDDTDNWDTESLRQYLERRGILDGDGNERSSASVTVTDRSSNYDPNGFYLSEGPNGARETRRERIRRLFLESGGDISDF
ncbi:MAG: hypothetical protein ABIQ30_15415 [Devosia sp.]